MSPPRNPNLHVVDGNRRRDNPENPYKTAFFISMITAVGSVLATLGVQWVINRAKGKGRAEEYAAIQQQPMFAPPVPIMQPGGTFVYVPAGAMPTMNPLMNPGISQQQPQMQFPQALQYQTPQGGRRRAPPLPANDTAPDWFAAFAKKQDARFKKLEAQIADDYEEDEAG